MQYILQFSPHGRDSNLDLPWKFLTIRKVFSLIVNEQSIIILSQLFPPEVFNVLKNASLSYYKFLRQVS